jgi:UDPglucose 6-dehydrogenase
VGLVTGACLAAAGHEVFCTDIDENRINQLKAGKVPIYEEHLDEVLKRAVQEKKISYTSNAGEAIRAGEVIFICVGTPPKDSGQADLSQFDQAARRIAMEAHEPKLVVEKSTVPALTGVQLQKALAAYSLDGAAKFQVVSNFFHPDRIVVGVEDEKDAATLREIYRPILERKFHCPVHAGKCPTGTSGELLVTTISSAELIKYASNSFLALKISYANVIADLCERIGADVEEVTHAMGLDPRIGRQFLKAGLGFGGFSFTKDIQAFSHLSATLGVEFDMLKAAERINKQRIDRFFEKVRKALWVIRGKRVAVLGLAFKANTDDIRFAPALEVIRRLLEEGAHVHATDPQAISQTKHFFPNVSYFEDPYEALKGADAALVCTEWPIFRELDWEKAGHQMSRRLVIDGRNLYNTKKMQALGFDYYSFGRS